MSDKRRTSSPLNCGCAITLHDETLSELTFTFVGNTRILMCFILDINARNNYAV